MSLLVKLCVNGLQFNKQDLFGNASSWNTVVYHTSGALRGAHHLIAVAQKANAISCFTASTNHSRGCDRPAYGCITSLDWQILGLASAEACAKSSVTEPKWDCWGPRTAILIAPILQTRSRSLLCSTAEELQFGTFGLIGRNPLLQRGWGPSPSSRDTGKQA